MYIDLAGFNTRLITNLKATDRHLPIALDEYNRLLGVLAYDDFSFLEIRDGNASEVIKVTNVCGKLVIDRGMEQTTIKAFRCGTGVAFILTMSGVEYTVCQLDKCG